MHSNVISCTQLLQKHLFNEKSTRLPVEHKYFLQNVATQITRRRSSSGSGIKIFPYHSRSLSSVAYLGFLKRHSLPCNLYMVANGTFSRFSNHVIFTGVFELVFLVLLIPLICNYYYFLSKIYLPYETLKVLYFVMSKNWHLNKKWVWSNLLRPEAILHMKQDKRAIFVNLRSIKHLEDCLGHQQW